VLSPGVFLSRGRARPSRREGPATVAPAVHGEQSPGPRKEIGRFRPQKDSAGHPMCWPARRGVPRGPPAPGVFVS
jgi:hypothetical protein